MRIFSTAIAGSIAVALCGCSWLGVGPAKQPPPPPAKATSIKSFSETSAVTAVQPAGATLWVGTSHGLIKWDVAKQTDSLVTSREGLPSDKIAALASDGKGGVWVMTAGGLSHESKGTWQNLPPQPVGAFVTGLTQTDDGALWVAGPEGLAVLRAGKWTRLLGDTSVTAVAAAGNDLWIGTSGKGVLRVHGDSVELYGAEQGCETDTVRGLAATPSGVMAVGDGPGGQRMAFFDGRRFFSYRVEAPRGVVFEWIRRVGDRALIGAGSSVWSIERVTGESPQPGQGPLRMLPSPGKTPKPPLTGPARGELPSAQAAPPPVAPAAVAAPAKASAGDDKNKKPEKKADEKAAKEDPPEPPPVWTVAKWGPQLPDGITCAASEGATLWVGTRFLGASKVEEGALTHFRTYNLARDAERLTVACEAPNDCWVATGTERAWHFDGQAFGAATIDPEPGARVLAVLNPPKGTVIAIHRGAANPVLRISSVSGEGTWTPTGATELQVPEGVPDVTFATFAPDKRLWLGLRYIDKDGDKVDYGAAEVDLEQGHVIYHRQVKGVGKVGRQLPNDIESAYFASGEDAWFGTRSGLVHWIGDQQRFFTENDGLESEIVHDVALGTDGQVWIATSRGVGRYDGIKWSFPKEDEPTRVKASSLARDKFGAVFVGATGAKGALLLCRRDAQGAEQVDRLDSKQGLLDNAVLDLAVDKGGRVWALTEKGISIVDR